MENSIVNPLPGTPGRFRQIFTSRWVRYFITFAVVMILILIGLYVVFLYKWGNPPPTAYGVGLADLDGDGDLDAFFANGQSEGPRPNTVLINQGGAQGGSAGVFKDSGQRLGKEESRTPVLADLDGDGDLDAWVVNMGYQTLYSNDGLGGFSQTTTLIEEDMGGTGLWSAAFGDLDGDGDLDAVGAGCCGAIAFYGDNRTEVFPPFNVVWINQGGRQGGQAGDFRSDITMPSLGGAGVALGDLDGDGDLDAFFANDFLTQTVEGNQDDKIGQPDTVWMNPGDGVLADSGQRLGSAKGQNVVLGDLDGDGDLDAFVANRGPDEVWLNGGSSQPGEFADSGQRLGTGTTNRVILSDLDGDADLDALLVVQDPFHIEVWLNDGRAFFTDSGQRIINPRAQAFTLGDLDGDGDADLFAGWYEAGYAVWWNRGNGTFTP
jgi:hypothetical protein